MRVIYLLLLLLSSVATLSHPTSKRRVLHQPLYPVDSAPPPSVAPPPPPPLPDQPFFPESPPNGQTPDQSQLTPPSSPSNLSSAAPLPVASQPPGHTKKVAIALSVAIVTLGMLSALAFFLYRHRATHPTEAQKLVGPESGGAAPAPPQAGSDFLYLGTMEPSGRRSASASGSERNGGITASPSPYHKLNSLRDTQFHRPSPELQPLPPLRRAQIENNSSIGSPLKTNYTSSVASSDDVFFSPNASADTSSVPSVKNVIHTSNSSNPHSRRSSPKSRLSYSAPDVKQVIVASPPPSQDPQSLNSQPRTPSPPKRKTKFASPPSPPSSNSDVTVTTTQATRIPVPPPPPPPPPPSAVPAKKDIPPEKNASVAAKLVREVPRPQSMMPTPTRPMGAEPPVPVVDVTQSSASSDSQLDAEDEDGAKPKLKPLHWDKVRATSDRAMVWDQFKSSSFHLNEDRIETLFGCNTKNPAKKESPRTSVLPQLDKENRVLDPKKSQNIAILLRALNVTRDEVSEALLEGNPDGLGAELLETLVKMAPTKEEELKLRDYSGDISKLGTAERFLKAILDVPFAFKRVDAMLYRANFDTEVKYLRKSFEALQAACEELKNSRLFLKLLEAVLRTGNRMNVGTNRGDAKAFKLDTLLKLLDIKGVDGKTTVLHFVVQEIIRSEAAVPDKAPDSPLNKVHPRVKDDDIQKQGLQVVAGLGRELANVKKAAGMDSDVLHSYVSKLEVGLEKVRTVLQYEKSNTKGKFFEAMKLFLGEAHEEILRVKGEEKKSLSHVKEVTEYFHGDTAKEEAHPFRIFMVVRDFLTVLDQVCREVGRIQERTVVGSARSFRMPASASLPVLNRYNVRRDASSDEDSSSP